MPRRTALAVIALALVVPATALSISTQDYTGGVKDDPNSYAGFNIKRTDHGRKVKQFITDRVDFSCTIGTPGETETMLILATFPVKDREFKGKGEAVGIDADPFGKVTGKFKRGGKAAGTLKLRGELDGNAGSECSTGRVEWRAEKSGPVMWRAEKTGF